MISGVTPTQVKDFVFKWTPRVLIVGFVGYYSLGFAYSTGLMAAIDKVAIPIIQHFVGLAGLGATMPIFQWYSALAVRVIAAGIAELIYEGIEKVIRMCLQTLRSLYSNASGDPLRSQ